MGRRKIEVAVEELLESRGEFSSADLSRATGLTRQALHRHLSSWVGEGRLVREGRARATRYRWALGPGGPSASGKPGGPGRSRAGAAAAPAPARSNAVAAAPAGLGRSYPVATLSPERAWRDLESWLGVHAAGCGVPTREVLGFAARELVANAIEHAGASHLTLRAHATPERVALAIRDDGAGIFERLSGGLGLDGPLAAVRRLQEGRVTTRPQQHAGEGLFLLSRSVGLLELDANGFEWVFDGEGGDHALSEVAPVGGTEVRIAVDPTSDLTPGGVRERHGSVVPERHVARLADFGPRLVTRSQACHVLRGLERYREVALDFTGVEGVGLGFVDELLRRWPSEHPRTRLVPVNTNTAVDFMIRTVPDTSHT